MFCRPSRTAVRILCVAILLSSCVYFTINRQLLQTKTLRFDALGDLYRNAGAKPTIEEENEIDAPPKDESLASIVDFWKSFRHALKYAKPRIEPIVPLQTHSEQNFNEAYPNLVHEELIDIPERDKKRLVVSHSVILKHLDKLVPQFPFAKESQGIVTTAGEDYIGPLLVSLRMLRRVGSTLPVEAFFDSRSVVTDKACAGVLRKLNVECKFFGDILGPATKLRSIQLKIFALLFSSFEDVLFLDADAFPANDPDRLLRTRPFTDYGLVTWPDFWSTTTSATFWQIARVAEDVVATEQNARASTESGILLVSKSKHARTLLLAAYYNYYGPGCYYPLLSQGAQGEGDKETFLHAAIALNAPFHAVRAGVQVLGDFWNEKWESAGMKQMDPTDDFEKNVDKVVNAKARPMFVHHNIVKLDPNKLYDHHLVKAEEDQKPRRLWGTKESTVETFGKDLEYQVWEEITAIACETSDELCRKAEDRLEAVYMD